MQLYTAKLCISLASRMRAAESAIYYTWHGDAKNDICKVIQAQGQEHDAKVKKALSSGRRYNLSTPIHVVQWLAAVDALIDIYQGIGLAKTAQLTALNKYKVFSTQNLPIIADEVCYFRRITCHERSKVKLIVRVEAYVGSPESAQLEPMEHGSVLIFAMLRDYFKDCGFKSLQGVAPRNKNERELIKILSKHSIQDDE